MQSRSHAASPALQETSYQAQPAVSNGCACTQKPYGLSTTCIEHSPHGCPGRINQKTLTRVSCGGVLQLVKAAKQLDMWSATPAVLRCSRCPTSVGVLLTYQSTFPSTPLRATYSGPCPGCRRLLLVQEDRPTEGEHSVVADVRFREAAFHAVPACQHFKSWDLIDVCLRALGNPPTLVVQS